jgi:hypothetical protein
MRASVELFRTAKFEKFFCIFIQMCIIVLGLLSRGLPFLEKKTPQEHYRIGGVLFHVNNILTNFGNCGIMVVQKEMLYLPPI